MIEMKREVHDQKGSYVFLCGEPNRVAVTASRLDNADEVSNWRATSFTTVNS